MPGMRRREFVTLLGGAACAWPLPTRAQQPAMPVVGFLNFTSPDGFEDRLRAFRQGLRDTGYVEGVNVAIEYRWAGNRFDQLPALAAELVRRQVAVIAAASTTSALAAKAATATIPIVFVSGADPVRVGLVSNLARPDGNLTGISFVASELTAKRLELLRELVPGAHLVGVLVNPANAELAETTLKDVEPTTASAHLPGLDINIVHQRSAAGDSERILSNMQAVHSFEEFGRFLETASPFAFWTQATQVFWAPGLEASRVMMLPWTVARPLPKPEPASVGRTPGLAD